MPCDFAFMASALSALERFELVFAPVEVVVADSPQPLLLVVALDPGFEVVVVVDDFPQPPLVVDRPEENPPPLLRPPPELEPELPPRPSASEVRETHASATRSRVRHFFIRSRLEHISLQPSTRQAT